MGRGMLAGMRRRTLRWQRWLGWAVCASLAVAAAQAAVPLGYRYVGSRAVSAGRVVYWYWNVDYVEIVDFGAAFVARMYARAVDVDQERPFVAVIRCQSRTYRALGSTGPYEAIDGGEPIDAVWRAGCSNGHALGRTERYAQLAGPPGAAVPAPAATTALVAAAPPAKPAAATVGKARGGAPDAVQQREDVGDPRRVDRCLHFAETKSSPGGDAAITNTCAFPIEVTLCYKGGGGGIYDCPGPTKGKRAESLGPGVTHALPEYRRGRQKGIAAIACKGTLGSVFPRLDDAGGKSGCF